MIQVSSVRVFEFYMFAVYRLPLLAYPLIKIPATAATNETTPKPDPGLALSTAFYMEKNRRPLRRSGDRIIQLTHGHCHTTSLFSGKQTFELAL